MMNKKVTVIIPVYNVIKYMETAINSVVNQTYKNLEIILVDDGSTDSSGDKCNTYAECDSRIKVYHQKNGGLSAARNTGLEYTTGDYVMFFDSDDWMDNNCIEKCMFYIQKEKVDCLVFPYVREFKNKSIPNYILGNKNIKIECGEILEKILYGPIGKAVNEPQKVDDVNMVINKVYKKNKVIKHRFLPRNYIGSAEDLAFNIMAFSEIKSIYYATDIKYHYNKMNETSITNSYDSRLLDTQNNLYRYINEIILKLKKDNSYKQAFYNRRLIGVLGLILNIVKSDYDLMKKKQLVNELLIDKNIKERFDGIIFHNYNVFWRMFWKCCKYEQSLLVLITLELANKLKTFLK